MLKIPLSDARETALAIAAKLGIGRDFAVSGEEISTLDETELTRLANKANVFYRTSPQHKLKIVKVIETAIFENKSFSVASNVRENGWNGWRWC